jgi:hypothetical protein
MKNFMEVFVGIVAHLEQSSIDYMIVGSVASIIYGEPRMTRDMDLVLDIQPTDVSRFEKLFPFESFYCPPPEVLKQEVVERGQFNLIPPCRPPQGQVFGSRARPAL